MALTRKMLKAMGIDEEKIDQIIEAHTEATDALKTERDRYKEDADRLDDVQKELNTLKSADKEDWKAKHDAVKKEFDDYKSELAGKEALKAKKSAFAKIAKSKGITDEKLIALIANNYDFSKEELDGENLKNEKTIGDYLTTEYSGYVSKDGKSGASVDNPPKNVGGYKTKEEIYKKDDNGRYVLSASERQRALAANPELLK